MVHDGVEDKKEKIWLATQICLKEIYQYLLTDKYFGKVLAIKIEIINNSKRLGDDQSKNEGFPSQLVSN